MGSDKSDHDYILELHQAIYGVNGQGGLVREVHAMNLSISGNPNAISFEDKQGIAGTLRSHIHDDKLAKKQMWAIIGLLVTAATAISHHVIDWLLGR